MRKVTVPFVLLCLLMVACESLTTPERYYDHEASPPALSMLDVGRAAPYQHVTGTIRLMANVDTLDFQIARVEFRVDDQLVHVAERKPWTFDLDTRQFVEGARMLSLNVYAVGDPSHGLLNLFDVPSATYRLPVTFDHRPPTRVEFVSAAREGHRVTVSWEESSDDNFYGYILERNHGGRELRIDTLFDRGQTSITDSLSHVIGLSNRYGIAVTNRATASWNHLGVGMPSVEVDGGETRLPAISSVMSFVSPSNESYYLLSASPVTVRKMSIPHLDEQASWAAEHPFNVHRHATMSPRGDVLVLVLGRNGYSDSLRVTVLDARSLREVNAFHITNYVYLWSVVVTDDGRLIIGTGDGEIDAYRLTDGAELGRLATLPFGVKALHPRGSSMIVEGDFFIQILDTDTGALGRRYGRTGRFVTSAWAGGERIQTLEYGDDLPLRHAVLDSRTLAIESERDLGPELGSDADGRLLLHGDDVMIASVGYAFLSNGESLSRVFFLDPVSGTVLTHLDIAGGTGTLEKLGDRLIDVRHNGGYLIDLTDLP